MKRTIVLLAALAAFGAALSLPKLSAFAEESLPQEALFLEEVDANGEKVTVPVFFDGEEYFLCDKSRGIYVYDGSNAEDVYAPITDPDLFSPISSQDGVFSDAVAISVYFNTILSYDFYTKENVGVDWRGPSGAQDPEKSHIGIYVHMNRTPMRDNAAFHFEKSTDQAYLLIGDGGAYSAFYRQGRALDIIAHEYQHGISIYMNRGLSAEGDSGALGEAFSDIFGMLVEGHDPSEEEFWQIGEKGTTNGNPIRSIKDPSSYPKNSDGEPEYLTSAKDKKTCSHRLHDSECDYGYVHANCTIISHVQYTAYALYPEYFTRERIGKLWFKTLDLITQVEQQSFPIFAKKIIEAAKSLSFEERAILALQYSLYSNGFGTEPVYRVEFVNPNGQVISSELVLKGERATPPLEASMEPSGLERYEFLGWEEDVNAEIYSDQKITALYRTIERYRIEYQDLEGNVLLSEVLDVGEAPTPPPDPVRESTKEYDFAFSHWQESEDDSGGKVMTPVFQETLRSYEITLYYGNRKTTTSLQYGAELPDPPPLSSGWYFDRERTVSAAGTTIEGPATLYSVSYVWVLYAAGGTVLLLGALVIFLMIKRKKGKKNRL